MKKVNLFATTIAFCAIMSINAFAQKPSSCGPDVTNLSVRVELGSYNILPDIDSPYKTGKTKGDQIWVMFQLGNCSQDFTLNLNFSKRYMAVYFPNGGGNYQAKFYNFDRVASVPITTSANFLQSEFCLNGADPSPNGFVVTKNGDGTYRDNYAGCSSDAGGNFVRRNVGISLVDTSSSADYRLRFQRSPLDGGVAPNLVAGTTFIKVYHPTETTWVLEPENVDDPNTVEVETYSPGAKLLYSNGFSLSGVYHMPFKFTLIKV